MSLRTSIRSACCLAVGLVAAAGASAVDAADRRDDLEAIRAQVARLEAQLERIDRESGGLERELERVDVEINLQAGRLTEVRLERSLAEESLQSSEQRLLAVQTQVEQARASLNRRLLSLYRRDERHAWRSFVESRSAAEVLGDVRLIRLATRGDAIALRRYREGREELVLQVERVKRVRAEVEELALREQKRLARLETMRAAQRRALEILERRREGMVESASRLLDKEEKLSMLLEILSGRESPRQAGLAIGDFKGALDWPVQGRILTGFGPRLDKRYRTRIPHNGVEIETAPGSSVLTVFPGVVVFAAPFEDLGVTVVVHHPERVLSLYAGLEGGAVVEGDVVSFSDLVGRSRDSVYFEIRSDNQPQDPVSWLR